MKGAIKKDLKLKKSLTHFYKYPKIISLILNEHKIYV